MQPTQPPCWSAAPVNKPCLSLFSPFFTTALSVAFHCLCLTFHCICLNFLAIDTRSINLLVAIVLMYCRGLVPTLTATHCRRLSSQVESVVNFVDSTQRVHKDDILRTLHTILKAEFSDAIK